MNSSGPATRLDCEMSSGVPDLTGASGIIHDLGNLIQIATSALNTMSRNRREGRDGSDPVLTRARIALERAGTLVRQSMARSSEAGLVIRKTGEPQCIASCLRDIEGLVSWVCEPDIELAVSIRTTMPLVRCNSVELQNAVLNLVINARDAMPTGGALHVSAATVGDPRRPAWVEITVSDSGCGMTPAVLQRVFDTHFTTKPEGRGSGLGLAMVRRFAEEAGGRAEARSVLGVGSTFSIILPAAATA